MQRGQIILRSVAGPKKGTLEAEELLIFLFLLLESMIPYNLAFAISTDINA